MQHTKTARNNKSIGRRVKLMMKLRYIAALCGLGILMIPAGSTANGLELAKPANVFDVLAPTGIKSVHRQGVKFDIVEVVLRKRSTPTTVNFDLVAYDHGQAIGRPLVLNYQGIDQFTMLVDRPWRVNMPAGGGNAFVYFTTRATGADGYCAVGANTVCNFPN
jgi:hypothetical protein